MLLGNDKKYLSLIESIQDGYYEVDIAGDLVFYNTALCEILGYSREELAGMNNRQYLDNENADKVYKVFNQVYKTGKPFKAFDWQLIRKDGSRCYVETSVTLVKDIKGKPIGFQGMARDISERKKADEALKISEAKMRSIFKSAPIGIGLVVNRVLLEVNEQLCSMVQLSNEELIGNNARILYPSDADYEYVGREKYRQIRLHATGTVETHFKRKDGQIIDVLMSSTPIDVRDLSAGVTFSALDITKRIQAEEALRQSEERYRDIFNSLMDVYFRTTIKGIIENASPSSEAVLGYSAKELIGQNVDMLYQDLKDREELLKALRKKGQVRGFELQFKKKDGTPCSISVNAALNYGINGEPLGLSGTIRDSTERKQQEQEKLIAQHTAAEHEKYALVGQIAGKMAHDFNNILAAIMGNTELALLDCPDAKIRKTLQLVFDQAIRGKNLTRNLVAFAKDQEPKQEYFRINEKIELVLNLLAKELECIDVIRAYGSGLPDLLADPGMIEHALVNLVHNSLHAISMVEHPNIVIRTYQKGEPICLEIEDNGCGIPEEFLDKIYDPAFTLKGSKDQTGSYRPDIKGTGYGMSNVKKYIDQHKGTISITSKVGKGTKTTITLPVIKKELTAEEIAEVAQEEHYSRKYILLVEDEQAISDVQYQILTTEPCNHKVDIAPNGKVALDLYDRNKYDFISLDYLLPGEINGMDIYRHIRQSHKKIPILFVSGNLEFLESIKIMQQRDIYLDHLSKPCQNLQYVKSINRLMES